MVAPNNVTARSTISMARSTPAQKPRGLANSICIRFSPSFKQGIQQEAGGTDSDRRIRHVKRRKIRSIPMKVNEVDDMAQANAIDDIAERTAKDQRQSAGQQAMRSVL